MNKFSVFSVQRADCSTAVVLRLQNFYRLALTVFGVHTCVDISWSEVPTSYTSVNSVTSRQSSDIGTAWWGGGAT